MDYLAFGLLAGSLIVIVSFVVRDGLPHLSAVTEQSRLARVGRAAAPVAWDRWCADTGLVLAGAGTLVLVITVAALLADLSDGAGSLLVGLSAAVALIGSVLGAARLGQRLRVEADAETAGGLTLPIRPAPSRRPRTNRPARDVEPLSTSAVQPAAGLAVDTDTVWDDDLPIWSGPLSRTNEPDMDAISGPPTSLARKSTSGTASPELDSSAAVPEAVTPAQAQALSSRRSSGPATEPTYGQAQGEIPDDELGPPVAGGRFRSPLLADIGLTPIEREADERFQSPLLSGLLAGADGHDGAETDVGSDLLIDEAPAPVQPVGRVRDELDNR